MSWKYAAIIVNKDNNIVSIGRNYYTYGSNKFFSIHAEMDALINCKNKKELNGASMYIVRIDPYEKNKNDRFMNAYPCNNCYIKLKSVMKKYGLKNVFFTVQKSNRSLLKK